MKNKYQTIKLNKIKNFVKGLMFDVECENWWDRFVYAFEDWKNSITNQSDHYKQALEKIEEIGERDGSGDYDFIKWKIKNIISEVKEKNENS